MCEANPYPSIAFVEELSLNAWPALQTILYDGWLIRLAKGYTRRANSVNPIYGSSLDVLEKIAYCERVYEAQGQNVAFKITGAVQPADLDAVLAEQGYAQEALTGVQTLKLEGVEPPSMDTVRLEAQVTDSWLSDFCRLNAPDPRHIPVMTQILGHIVPPCCFLSLYYEGETASVGLAVAERGYVGLFDLVTAPELRGRGLGRQMVLHLLQWGKSQGAEHAYLQVMADNVPALRLYHRLGFREAYSYWYRVKRRT